MFWPHHMGGFGWGFWILGALVMLLVLGALITLVFFLVRAGAPDQNGSRRQSTGSDAIEILKQRYARGDISKAEYEEMRHELET